MDVFLLVFQQFLLIDHLVICQNKLIPLFLIFLYNHYYIQNDVYVFQQFLLYHKFFQNCYFKEDPLKEKKRLLADGVLTYNEYLKLDEDKLISIMKMDIFKEVKDLNLFKEQKFCVFISPSELGYEGAEGNILVQGIADLIAEKENGEIILADYKFSSLINEADLVSKYKKQLYLYKTAIEKVMNKKVVKTCLVNILQMKTTEIDFGGAERE